MAPWYGTTLLPPPLDSATPHLLPVPLQPPALGKLSHLVLLDVSHNSFSGPIPANLEELLPTLTTLSVAFNNLSAPIPPTLHHAFCYPQFEGNPGALAVSAASFPACPHGTFSASPLALASPQDLILSPLGWMAGGYTAPTSVSTPPTWGVLTGIILGGIACVVVVVAALIALCLLHGSASGFKRLTKQEMSDLDCLAPLHLRRFSLREVKTATANFKSKHAEGGSCYVYHGTVEGVGEVAVKRMKQTRVRLKGAHLHPFLNEVALLSKAAHRHIVPILGFCVEGGERILLFPFFSNGSVASHFPGEVTPTLPCRATTVVLMGEERWAGLRKAGEKALPLLMRRSIACHTARALSYLHSDCSPPILHRDVKAGNVVVAHNMEAALGDFGLATHLPGEDTHVRGTHGHVAPGEAHTPPPSPGRTFTPSPNAPINLLI